jgi:hypothetical protein
VYIDEKYFGMTDKEIRDIKNEILSWTDSNHPVIEATSHEDGFCVAFSEGIDLLFEDLPKQ